PIPKLCTLVTASPFDAAIHDAFGKVHGRNCYQTYGPDLMAGDLTPYLGPQFKDESLNQYHLHEPRHRVALIQYVRGAEGVTEAEIQRRLNDGLPETLAEWIEFNGLTHIKIKLQGD